MDFLFTPLPATNFIMSDEELKLWQRNAIFECECDNFINRRLENANMQGITVMQSAIDAAINSFGLQARADIDHDDEDDDDDDHYDGESELLALIMEDIEDIGLPPAQRRKLADAIKLDEFYEDVAIEQAIQAQGIVASLNP